MFEHFKAPQTINELVDAITEWLGEKVWPDLSGYADALPEPDTNRAVERSPFFVVTAPSGTAGVEPTSGPASRAQIAIYLQVRSSKSDGTDYLWAVRTLRDCIDGLRMALYRSPTGITFGARPGSMSWEIPDSQPRPVWQAAIHIEFEVKSAARDNAEFLC